MTKQRARLRQTKSALPLALFMALASTSCSGEGALDSGPSASGSATIDSREAEATLTREYLERLANCMTDAGFPAEIQPDGGLRINAPKSQDAAYDAALRQCEELSDPPSIAPVSPEEASDLYDDSLKAYECLIAEGFSPAEPPSREKFLQDYADRREPWDPFWQPDTQTPLPDDVCEQPSLN